MAKTAETKTKVSNASVTDFLNSIDNEQKRKDSFEILNIMKQLTHSSYHAAKRRGIAPS